MSPNLNRTDSWTLLLLMVMMMLMLLLTISKYTSRNIGQNDSFCSACKNSYTIKISRKSKGINANNSEYNEQKYRRRTELIKGC